MQRWRGIASGSASPSTSDVTDALDTLRDEWTPPDNANVLEWASNLFDIPDDASFIEIADASADIADSIRKLESEFGNIVRANEEADTNGDDRVWTREAELQYREALELANQRCFICKVWLQHHHALQSEDPLPKAMRLSMDADVDNSKKTPFQRTLIFILESLARAGLKRVGDKCYREVRTDEGEWTHAFEEDCTIMNFVMMVCNRHDNYEKWADLFASKCSIGDDIVKQLQRGCDEEFPLLDPDRHLVSFRNGLYHMSSNMFYPWAERARWGEMAASRNARFEQEHVLEDGNVTRMADSSTLQKAVAPTRKDVAMKFFDTDFPLESLNNWREAPTPEVDQILDVQKILGPVDGAQDESATASSREWVYAMLGRLFYMVGDKDNWQKIPFFYGVAGSGKSTICQAITYVFPSHDVGTLGHEDRFALAALLSKKIWVCPEVRKNSPEFLCKHQGDFQMMVSGEEVSVAIKCQTAKTVPWTAPGLLCGNQVPNVSDAAGSIWRRFFAVEFNNLVPVRALDPQLFDNLKRNIGGLILKANMHYLHLAHKHGDKDLNVPGVLPAQIHEFSKNLSLAVDPATRFVEEGRDDMGLVLHQDIAKKCVEHGHEIPPVDEVYMKWNDFGALFTKWLDQTHKPRQSADPDTFKRVFFNYGILEQTGSRDYAGRATTTKWLVGIGEKERFQQYLEE